MIVWTAAGGGVIILLAIILSSFIECKVIIHKSGKYERVILLFRTCYGMLYWKYEWRLIRFINRETGFYMYVKSGNNVGTGHVSHRKTQIDRRLIEKYINSVKHLLHHTRNAVTWIKGTFRRVHCSRFSWDTEIGLCDPAMACLLSGSFWSVKSAIAGAITYYMRFEVAPKLEITPQFNSPFFSTRVVCITKIRIVHAIGAIFKLMIRIVCVEGGIRTWRNILSGV